MNQSNRYDRGRDDNLRQRPQQQYGGGQNRFQGDDDYNQDPRGGRYAPEYYAGQENPQQHRFEQNDWQERESRGYRQQGGFGGQQDRDFGARQGYGGGYGMGQGGRDWQSGMNQGNRDWQSGNFQGYGGSEHRAYEDSSMRGSGQNFGGQHGSFAGQGYGSQSGLQQRRGPKGYTRSDDRIKEDVCERLTQRSDLDVEEVSIEVRNGTVTLEGTVPERRMKHMIEDIACGCMGVQDVDNKLRLEHNRGENRSGSSSRDSTASSAGNKTRKE